jgi:hypothetical protein
VSPTEQSEAIGSPARGRFSLRPPFDRLAFVWVLLGLCLLSALGSSARTHFDGPGGRLLLVQDLPVFGVCLAITLALGWIPARSLTRLAPALRWPSRLWLLGLAGVCFLAAGIGTELIFRGYDLSLDEFLADFDARIFAHGQLAAPIAPLWRPFAPALQPRYMLPIQGADVWASAYLPVNAALRALASKVGLEAWLSPLYGGFSVIATFAVGRRLWPQTPSMALCAAALLASATQLTMMAMTSYAMSAHLAFNLAWLWLFLRGGRLGHAGAIAVGFFATGLHQLLFHPMFVAPFVFQLWLDRRWRLAGAYTFAYAAIGGFWTEYWQLELHVLGEAPQAAQALGANWLVQRTGAVLAQVRPGNLGAMATSLVRLITWQNPLTAPLALLGARAAWRQKGHLRALLAGVGLTLLAMLIIEPTQTHGWGYRYLHGLLGSVCLLAAWTWASLLEDLPERGRAAANGALVAAIAVSLLVLLPLRGWQAWTYTRPYAAANAVIQSAPEPIVIVDDEGPWFDMGTVVRNDPYLAHGPKVVLLAALDPQAVRTLCARGPVGRFDGRQAAALAVATFVAPPDPWVPSLRATLANLGCGRDLDARR